jgi:hypothetical protein
MLVAQKVLVKIMEKEKGKRKTGKKNSASRFRAPAAGRMTELRHFCIPVVIKL